MDKHSAPMDKHSAPMDKHSAPDPSRLPAGPPLKLRAHGQPRGLTTPYMSPVGALPHGSEQDFSRPPHLGFLQETVG
jgi:hypothetical protein